MTQGEQILRVLGDGRYHTTAEILRAVPCVVHSRVSELRRRGHVIVHRGSGGGAAAHEYRLERGPLVETSCSEPDSGFAGLPPGGVTSGDVSTSGTTYPAAAMPHEVVPLSGAAVPLEQLSIFTGGDRGAVACAQVAA